MTTELEMLCFLGGIVLFVFVTVYWLCKSDEKEAKRWTTRR
jgi:hypothetical protein